MIKSIEIWEHFEMKAIEMITYVITHYDQIHIDFLFQNAECIQNGNKIAFTFIPIHIDSLISKIRSYFVRLDC